MNIVDLLEMQEWSLDPPACVLSTIDLIFNFIHFELNSASWPVTSFPIEMMAHLSFTGQQSEDPGLDSNTKLNSQISPQRTPTQVGAKDKRTIFKMKSCAG